MDSPLNEDYVIYNYLRCFGESGGGAVLLQRGVNRGHGTVKGGVVRNREGS